MSGKKSEHFLKLDCVNENTMEKTVPGENLWQGALGMDAYISPPPPPPPPLVLLKFFLLYALFSCHHYNLALSFIFFFKKNFVFF